jgi:modulator of FtsH protease HflK
MADHPPASDDLSRPGTGPETPLDAGSQALSEAFKSSFGIVKFVIFILVCLFLGSGVFTVGPQEQAIIIRLGRPHGDGEKALLGPGLHVSFPYPIDEYRKIPLSAIQRVTSTVGWYATTPEQEMAGTEMPVPAGTPINPLVDGYVLTADVNIVHASVTMTYHISDPVGYIFNFVNASNAVQRALDNALLWSASQFKVDDMLTRDVAGFKETVRKRVTQLVEQQGLGVVVEDCTVKTKAPRQLQDAFADVLKAQVRREKVLNDARNYESQVTNRAGADAQSRLNSADSERNRVVKEVASEAERFNDLLPRFRENPGLFAQQRLTETFARVLTNAQDKIFLTESSDGKPKELRLLLNREAPKQTKTE